MERSQSPKPPIAVMVRQRQFPLPLTAARISEVVSLRILQLLTTVVVERIIPFRQAVSATVHLHVQLVEMVVVTLAPVKNAKIIQYVVVVLVVQRNRRFM